MNHLESPKVCKKVFNILMLVIPKIVKFPQNLHKTPFFAKTQGTIYFLHTTFSNSCLLRAQRQKFGPTIILYFFAIIIQLSGWLIGLGLYPRAGSLDLL